MGNEASALSKGSVVEVEGRRLKVKSQLGSGEILTLPLLCNPILGWLTARKSLALLSSAHEFNHLLALV